MTSCLKPFNDLADFYCAKWVDFQVNSMFDELVSLGLRQFPISFPSGTDAKIYLYVIVNKQILFGDAFKLRLEGETSVDRRRRCGGFFEKKKVAWKSRMGNFNIPIGSEVCFVMQGIAYTPNYLNAVWHQPAVDTRCELTGWKLRKGTTNVYWRGDLKEPSDVQNAIIERLSGYGVPANRIPDLYKIYNINKEEI